MFSTEQIANRLDDAMRLLTNGSRNAPIRHQTLGAAIDWSYGLLSDSEKLLFQRLSIFAGGWTVEAAEDVCADARGTDDVLTVLGHLVDKSLVVVEPTIDGAMRYRLQEVLRQYARRRLLEREAHAPIQERHAQYFLHLVEHAEPRALTVDRKAWLDRLELELDNFRAARAWFVARGDAEGAQSLAACLYRLLFYRGHAREGRQSLIEALALSGGSDSTRGKALQFLGGLAFTQADYPAVERYCGEALALRRRIANPSDIAASLTTLGVAATMRADFTAARAYLDEARQVGPTSDDAYVVPLSIGVSALAAYLEGDYAMARAHADAALDLARAAGYTAIECQALSTLGNLRYLQGDRDGAREALDAALARADTVGEPYLMARPGAAARHAGHRRCRPSARTHPAGGAGALRARAWQRPSPRNDAGVDRRLRRDAGSGSGSVPLRWRCRGDPRCAWRARGPDRAALARRAAVGGTRENRGARRRSGAGAGSNLDSRARRRTRP